MGSAPLAAVQAAMSSNEAKAAFKRTLSSTLGVDLSTIVIHGVRIFDASSARLLGDSEDFVDLEAPRRLSTLSVELDYEVELALSAEDNSTDMQDSLTERMTSIGYAEDPVAQ